MAFGPRGLSTRVFSAKNCEKSHKMENMKRVVLVLACALLLALAGCDKFMKSGSASNASGAPASSSSATASNTSQPASGDSSTNSADNANPGTAGNSDDSASDRDSEDQASKDRRADARKSLGL